MTYVAQANSGSDAFQPSRTIAKPGAVQAGDVAVLVVTRWHEAADFPAITPPSGAVLRTTVTTTLGQTAMYLMTVGAETGYTFSWGVDRWSSLIGMFFTGVDPGIDLATVPLDTLTGSGTTIGAVSVDTVTGADLAWHLNTVEYTTTTTHEPPTGFTEVADVNPYAAAFATAAGDGSAPASGATIDQSLNWAVAYVALAPASTGGTVNGTANVALGGLSLTATGKRVVHGTASVALGGLNVTGVGTGVGQTEGTATLDLGGITITAVGKRVVHGSAAITLGGITVHGTGEQAASINLDFVALAPVFRDRTATAPAFADRTAAAPELGHGEVTATLGHGQPGEPTL